MDEKGPKDDEGGLEEAHLSLETLAKLLSGVLEHDELLRVVIPHLLARCPECRARHEEIRRLQKEVGHWDEEVAVLEGRRAPELWERVSDCPYEEQIRRIEADEELHTWGFCQFLLKKCRDAGFADPGQAVELANLALRVVRHLGASYDPNWVMDLRARCFAYLGNARRVLGELRSSEDAFVKAEGCLARSSTGNFEVRAEILDLRSSLRRAQRRLDEAARMIDEALFLYREAGHGSGIAKSLIQKAKIVEETGDLRGAIDLLRKVEGSGEPCTLNCARYNLLGCLVLAERFDEAEALLPELRSLLEESAQPVDRIRLRWTEGLIALGRGRRGPAEAVFREVQRQFLERRMGYDAALVSLDLARLYAQEGCVDELKRLANGLFPAFESRDVHREALIALMMFQKACEEETLTAELAREIAGYLRRERRGPLGL